MGKGGQIILKKRMGGEGKGNVHDSEPSRGSGGKLPIKFLNFIPSEITSGAFSDSFVVLK